MRKGLLYTCLTIWALITLVPFAYMVCSAIKPKSVLFNAPFLPTDGLFAVDRSTGDLSIVDVNLLPPADDGARYEVEFTLSVDGEERSRRTLTIGYGATAGDATDLRIPDAPQVNQSLGRLRLGSEGRIELWPTATESDAAQGEDVLSVTPADRADTIEPADAAKAAGPRRITDADNSTGATDTADTDILDGETGPASAGTALAAIGASGAEFDSSGSALSGARDEPAATAMPHFEMTDGNPRGRLGVAWGLLTVDNFDRLFFGVTPGRA